ncbi:MAG: bifunctional riboflavin kinase/FAD synthetase [Clostridia bacterium]|nr:bifunctional riboflavin kinase/FAD synthetase [Clostridia bacterium]
MKNDNTSKSEYTAVALGNFDGLHAGHRSVLQKAYNYSLDNNIRAIALIFDIHPKTYFGKRIGLLMTDEDKKKFIRDIGIETQTVSFDEFRDFSAEEFVEKVLKNKLNAKAVFCGFNYHFGKGGIADAKELEKICDRHGIEVYVNEETFVDGEKVNSSRLRELLKSGDVEKANKLMTQNFSYFLEVVHGQKRGRSMGFPTANQYFPPDLVIPKFGVYASTTEIDGKVYHSFTNIGSRPTFPENDVRSETHIFDFDGDLYGKVLRVSLHKFMREEVKFSSPEELVVQLKKDKKTAEEYFASQE